MKACEAMVKLAWSVTLPLISDDASTIYNNFRLIDLSKQVN